ncbi:sensor [Oxalicibacterium flavum]|uniref:Sensor n=1 Tax=Oxalicibacterium flavum TaxID=179467 RepID=A0A8J2XYC0_9BURK|nr:FecR domain-containing protein [Oxalicibacterium flavum]GGC11537.1 sensor [Oxalicibacterium flavum]
MKISTAHEPEDRQPETAAGHATRKQRDAEKVGAALDTHRDALKTMFPVPSSRAPRRKRTAAAGTALAALLAAGLWGIDPAYRSEHFVTQIGERSTVELADGSRLVLDTATELTVQWHLRSRRVVLADGRAHFDVAAAIWRPFTVDAGQTQVRVVGTRFDVWRRPDGTSVSVYEGKVAVWRKDRKNAQIVLLPGQQAEVSDVDEAQALSRADIAGDTQGAWKDGRLVFLDTPLTEALAVIQRYHRAPIRLADAQTGRLTVSGVFDSRNTDQLLRLLPGILPLQVERKADGSTELGAR